MCLAIPGEVISIEHSETGIPQGKVSFGGVTRDVCFAYVPEVKVGDYVIVHVGFAISILDKEEAQKNLELIAEIESQTENTKNQYEIP